jgi:transcription elongation factor Elf1
MDLSHLDKKYFIDAHIYNCPFCKRNNVSYSMTDHFSFDWGENKTCHGYIVQCGSNGCGKTSMHLSFQDIRKYSRGAGYYSIFADGIDIDAALFFSQPTSYFVLDNRIPEKVRELIYEAENSRKSNYLVGASACLRKAIYELLGHEKTIVKNQKTGYADYQESMKALKAKFPSVAPELFDALGHIQEMASDNVHEGSWEAWDSPKLRFIIELAKATLHEIYVVPEERKERLGVLSQMKAVFSNSKNQQPETTEETQE